MKRKWATALLALTLAFAGTAGMAPTEKAEAASSGWATYGGITAIVYTDRTGSYPVSDTYIGATGEKTATGGEVYYNMYLTDANHKVIAVQQGSFSSMSPMKKFYIDNYVSKGSSRQFHIQMNLFANSSRTVNYGVWTTPLFTVYN